MPRKQPKPITASVLATRKRRVTRIARQYGFVGMIEYRHVYSHSGGAQYGLAVVEAEDLLTVYAEAFERDSNPNDFSLEAIIAHERGHQLFARHPRLVRSLPSFWSEGTEEIVASLLGSLLVSDDVDRETLIYKATFDAVMRGVESDQATVLAARLRELLEKLL